MSEKTSTSETAGSVPGVKPYDGPAGGWGALGAVARAVKEQMAVGREGAALRKVNQPNGFDCPGCAWPDPDHHSTFEFCENGAKAVAWEATAKRVTPAFFAEHTVSELWNWSDFALEGEGRLTDPMRYDAASDTFQPVPWDEAFGQIGAALRNLPEADAAEFYTSGRASNEAAFLYQLFVRAYGTNNFPDCSNMCHEATSVGLPASIGVGKGTVTLADFDHCDALFSFGHNPGTNHPRMLATLREVSRRGVPIIAFNPLRERGLERFLSPQSPKEMLTGDATEIAKSYYQVRIGGDLAVLKGMMKWLVEADAVDLEQGGNGLLDREFIAEHTDGVQALLDDLRDTRWDDIVSRSGLSRADIEAAAKVYARAERVIICYGMGMTQHRHGTENVQQMANLLLLRGNIGRQGAGIAPIRGHSNVQGDRTVGITEKPDAALIEGIRRTYGFTPPAKHGHDAVAAVKAINEGRSRALICLGGNLAVAMPDPDLTFAAMRKLDLAVHIATKLNRSHLITAGQSFILPCLGRTELDMQASGPQSVTVEDSMSMVHASQGGLQPASLQLRSEVAIIGGIAQAALPESTIDWQGMVDNYDLIRDGIESVFPAFRDFNERVRKPRGFRLYVGASERDWGGPGARAHFLLAPGLDEDPGLPADALTMATIRSHDQYNTTIYGLNDRYRGIAGRRDIVFVNADDLSARGLAHGDLVDITSLAVPGLSDPPMVRRYTAVAYDIPRGSVAMYYPEGNGLLPLAAHDPQSGTPAYKSIPVALRPAAA
ncbi:FdhF/YdeP family oxidoreductase [Frateuria aurantia]|uniref:Molybdopterin-dependent oxidoreductase alpha subunit n=1 Tax=Frateuria aurantia (strain ATCC 33424 / DSM 6220 / KCTC 2777 / LMG 1558 / NBRC 3245 / NCIMB 13370) TaxID=767434 RepID=H8KZH3_FRAAD|nr:FdhF/YdeP family oxidoreductase [Frateuria aurantia]AFC86215.1 molybdopterin-dependent oxidoreductase alpha subunit [Frateuria aurantia DSM 6220]